MDHNNRPYYNNETFNIGYSSLFRAGLGIIDPMNVAMADKLSINKDNQTGITPANLQNGNWWRVSMGQGGSVVTVGRYGDNLLDSDSISILKWLKDKWNSVSPSHLYSLLLRQFLLQPLQVSKLLLQLSKPSSLLLTENDQHSNDDLNNDELDTEIDFFPTIIGTPMSMEPSNDNNVVDVQVTLPVLQFSKLDTWSIISTIQQNLGIRSLWTSFQNCLIYDTVYPFARIILKRLFFQPLSTLIQPSLKFHTLALQTVTNSVAEFFIESWLLLPLSLKHIVTVMTMGGYGGADADESPSISSLKRIRSNYSFHWDSTLFTVQGLTLLKVLVNNFSHHWFEYIILYKLELTQLNLRERWIIIVLLEMGVDSIQLICKLPLESLINRFKWKYLIETNKVPRSNEGVIIETIDIHSQEIWTGLWHGWKLHWTSKMCSIFFKYINKMDPDLEWEKF